MLVTKPLPRLPLGSDNLAFPDRDNDPVITSDFADHGRRTPPSRTPGLDMMYRNTARVPPQRGLTSSGGQFIVVPGTPAIAAAAGIVRRVENTNRGVVIELAHEGGVVSTYRHLRLPSVRVGEGVTPGQPIGDVSFDPQDSEQVPHLHYELRVNGRLIDPGPFVSLVPPTKVGSLPPDTPDERVLRILRASLPRGGGFPWFLLVGLLLLGSAKRSRR